jgi:hypothetical protein
MGVKMTPENKINIHIGFVILTWNSEKVIGKCLESIFGMDGITPYVAVVDNGSTDKSADIIKKYIDKHPGDIKLIQYGYNMGTTVSRNAGIREVQKSSPDYYCILDSDTVVNNQAFDTLIREMELNVRYGLIGPAMTTSSGLNQMSARAFPTLPEKALKVMPFKKMQQKGIQMERQAARLGGEDIHTDSYPVDYLVSACWLARPNVIKDVGVFDERIFYAPEDAEYCIRVWKAGYQVAFCPSALIIHEWQRLSRRKLISRINWEHIKGLAYMFWKHKYLFTTSKLKKTFKTDLEEAN